MSFRSYREVSGEDRSGLLEQVVAQRARVAERLRAVRRVVAVASGKGGVGKSHVTVALASAMARSLPAGVGVLDADLKSPTAARLLGAHGPVRVDAGAAEPAVGRGGVKVFSTELLLESGQPLGWHEPEADRFLWRGALEAGALREFLSDVAWGCLDLLLVDLPPGGDRLTDLAELVPGLTGALMVTIPSEESKRSVERSLRSALDAGIRVLGVVENMSGYACRECGHRGPLFSGSAGTDLAREFGVPLLARIPFAEWDGTAGESGQPATPSPATELAHALRRVLP